MRKLMFAAVAALLLGALSTGAAARRRARSSGK
jgi:hypothetical protein